MIKRFALIAFVTASAFAQQPPPDDPIGRYLVPPDLIMSHSQELNLIDKQRAAIKSEVQKAQAKFIDMQWDMKEETEKMVRFLQQTPVDEARVLEQADKVMGLEREIKKTQLSLLIRIRNALTAEQLAKLDEIRRAAR
ncbi:MAG: periplasmic heavy metal sensor [Acidobacteriota bacterium]